MTKEIELYVNQISTELSEVKAEIARKERTKSRLEEKLRDPARFFMKESKRGAARIKKIRGEELPPKKTVFTRKSEVQPKTENSPAPVPADEKKSKWSLFE